MTFEERKQECIANGIVPGVEIECASRDRTTAKVWPVEDWYQRVDNWDIVVGESAEGVIVCAYEALFDRYAPVLTPAPAEPSEVDRLRERVEELEAEMRRLLPVLNRAEALTGFWGRITEGTGVATLNKYRALLTTNTPD
jgi:hypothetical protein